MREKTIENSIKKYLKDNNIYYFKVHGGYYGVSGIPDIIVCYKGRFVALEIKNEKGKTSKMQDMHIENIRKSGGIAFVVRSREEVKKIIEDIETV